MEPKQQPTSDNAAQEVPQGPTPVLLPLLATVVVAGASGVGKTTAIDNLVKLILAPSGPADSKINIRATKYFRFDDTPEGNTQPAEAPDQEQRKTTEPNARDASRQRIDHLMTFFKVTRKQIEPAGYDALSTNETMTIIEKSMHVTVSAVLHGRIVPYECHINLVDLPGFGMNIDNDFSWLAHQQYFAWLFERRIQLLQDKEERQLSAYQHEFDLAHALRRETLIFFVAPNMRPLSKLERDFLHHMQAWVKIIPVIAKVDTLSNVGENSELKQFTQKIREELLQTQVLGDNFELLRIGGTKATEEKDSKGNILLTRKYNWGGKKCVFDVDKDTDLRRLGNELLTRVENGVDLPIARINSLFDEEITDLSSMLAANPGAFSHYLYKYESQAIALEALVNVLKLSKSIRLRPSSDRMLSLNRKRSQLLKDLEGKFNTFAIPRDAILRDAGNYLILKEAFLKRQFIAYSHRFRCFQKKSFTY